MSADEAWHSKTALAISGKHQEGANGSACAHQWATRLRAPWTAIAASASSPRFVIQSQTASLACWYFRSGHEARTEHYVPHR